MINPAQSTIANRYQILSLIGAGGMSEVYEVKHLVTQEILAIKIIQQKPGSQQNNRFLREASLSQRLNSNGVVKIYDAWVENNVSYLVMERLRGDTLRNLAQKGKISRAKALEYVVKTLEILAQAHAIDIIHRDIKPENIFICEANDKNPVEQVKILDFGLSRQSTDFALTHTGYFLGTPWYMSPEQAMSPKSCLHYTDIWSVGVMIYEILTDCVPFEGETVPVICMHIYSSPHIQLHEKNITIPLKISEIVDRCLAKTPTQRPNSATDLAKEINDFLIEFAQEPVLLEQYRSRIQPNTNTNDSYQETQDIPTVKEVMKLKQIQVPSQIVRQIQEESKNLQFDTYLDLKKIDTPVDEDEFMDYQSTVPLSIDEINARLSSQSLFHQGDEFQDQEEIAHSEIDLNPQTQIDQHNPFFQRELYGENSIFNESQDIEKHVPTAPMPDHVLEDLSHSSPVFIPPQPPLPIQPQAPILNQETWINEDIKTDVTDLEDMENDISVIEELPTSTLFTWFLTVVLFMTSLWIWLGDKILKFVVNLF